MIHVVEHRAADGDHLIVRVAQVRIVAGEARWTGRAGVVVLIVCGGKHRNAGANEVLYGLFEAAGAADTGSSRNPDEREGAAIIIHRSDVIHDRSTNNSGAMRLWPLHSTPSKVDHQID